LIPEDDTVEFSSAHSYYLFEAITEKWTVFRPLELFKEIKRPSGRFNTRLITNIFLAVQTIFAAPKLNKKWKRLRRWASLNT